MGAEHPRGTTVLVLGILSIVVCGVIGPFAWKSGNEALREMDAQPAMYWSNRGHVTAGRICGIIGTAFLAIWVVFFLLWLVFVVAFFTGGA